MIYKSNTTLPSSFYFHITPLQATIHYAHKIQVDILVSFFKIINVFSFSCIFLFSLGLMEDQNIPLWATDIPEVPEALIFRVSVLGWE